ncbi:MAG: acyl-CoA desaturase [Dehalococcoidia bacterium]|nr:acyl-CoA desaturase [Dehalococcoidia bacterium]
MIWQKELSPSLNDTATPTLVANEYSDLRELVRKRGLFAKQQLNYLIRIVITFTLLAASITSLVVFDTFWIHVFNAAFLAFIYGQITFLVHDAGHNQIFSSGSKNRITAIWLSSLFLGGSSSWWVDKHNRHHVNPNVGGVDPDVEIPVLAFSREAALSKKGVYRLIVKYQVFLFFPILLLEAFNLRFRSINYLRKERLSAHWDAITLIVLHHVIYIGMLVYLIGAWQALMFVAVHHALFGLYLGCTFATNHIGMPVLNSSENMDYLRLQTFTARNLKANWLTGFLFGGLDSQIEHHLFPTVPRAAFNDLRKIVKPFCKERLISYSEVGFVQAYIDILKHLYRVGEPLRRG